MILLVLSLIISSPYSYGRIPKVKQWKRFAVSYHNKSWNGNPFDLRFSGRFTAPSGKVYTQPGFYADNNTWKIYFMPNEKGKWSFKTSSPDADLRGKSGSFSCVKSDIKGELVADKNRWKFAGGGGAFPVLWQATRPQGSFVDFRAQKASSGNVQRAFQIAKDTVGATLLGFGSLLIGPVGWAKDWPQSAVPYVEGKEGKTFNFTFWDRLNAKLDSARDRGMGVYIMLYGDDVQKPDHFGITPKSKKERRFFRYVIARLACYPIIMWDSGVDISEYRSNGWINWYGRWFRDHDPWQHPVGSRSGGGSGGIMPHTGTYYSAGDTFLPSREDLLKNLQRDVPIAHTDHWRPFIDRGNWDNRKIRIALWRCALSGFQAPYLDYDAGRTKGDYKYMNRGARYIKYATRFFNNMVQSNLLDIHPHDELVSGKNNVIMAANPDHAYILYIQNGGWGHVHVDLSAATGNFTGLWYNPRTGEKQKGKTVVGGATVSFRTPTHHGEDWVLLLQKTAEDSEK